MAVVGDRSASLAEKIKISRRRRDLAVARLTGAEPPAAEGGSGSGGVGDEDLPPDEGALQQLVAELEGEIER